MESNRYGNRQASVHAWLLTLCLLCFGSVSWAQDNHMFEPGSQTADQAKAGAGNTKAQRIDNMSQDRSSKGFEAATLRRDFVSNMKKGDGVTVNVFGSSLSMQVTRRDTDKQGNTTWHAQNSADKSHMTLVMSNGDIAGTVRTGGQLYSLQSLDNDQVGIIWRDESLFKEHDEAHPSGAQDPGAKSDSGSDIISNGIDTSPITTADDNGKVIRVIVAYTAAANTAVANMNAHIALAMSETNQSYINSGVNTSVELAHSYQTTYTETGNMSTDLTRIRTPSDSYMDEVHGLRDAHEADVVILMLSNAYGYCGLASTIMANETTAFAAVRASCATGYYSFGHEIGHLQGARHIITRDPSVTPFAYGHGYCQPGVSFGWRTVMAYGCPNGDGTRIPYWSNPYRTYGGVAMGIVGESNNARVLNETAYTVANFRVSEPVWTIGYDWNCDGTYSKADLDIHGDGTFTINGTTSGGSWWENHNMMVLTFTGGTKYVGRHQGDSMTGKMSTTGTLRGCWYGHPKNGFDYDALLDAAPAEIDERNVLGGKRKKLK
jgi:hypothetical protein